MFGNLLQVVLRQIDIDNVGELGERIRIQFHQVIAGQIQFLNAGRLNMEND